VRTAQRCRRPQRPGGVRCHSESSICSARSIHSPQCKAAATRVPGTMGPGSGGSSNDSSVAGRLGNYSSPYHADVPSTHTPMASGSFGKQPRHVHALETQDGSRREEGRKARATARRAQLAVPVLRAHLPGATSFDHDTRPERHSTGQQNPRCNIIEACSGSGIPALSMARPRARAASVAAWHACILRGAKNPPLRIA
jgi:hypothetical protein